MINGDPRRVNVTFESEDLKAKCSSRINVLMVAADNGLHVSGSRLGVSAVSEVPPSAPRRGEGGSSEGSSRVAVDA